MDSRPVCKSNGRISSELGQTEFMGQFTLSSHSPNTVKSDSRESLCDSPGSSAPWFPLLLNLLIEPLIVLKTPRILCTSTLSFTSQFEVINLRVQNLRYEAKDFSPKAIHLFEISLNSNSSRTMSSNLRQGQRNQNAKK